MIGQLTGTLLEKMPPQVVVDCHGVGYEVDVPMSTFYNLPNVGERVTLLTHFVVREDAQLLYGFASATERAVFRQLIKISGVGARTALSILSGMSVDDLAHAVASQEAGRLVKVPGMCWTMRIGAQSAGIPARKTLTASVPAVPADGLQRAGRGTRTSLRGCAANRRRPLGRRRLLSNHHSRLAPTTRGREAPRP